VLGVYSALQLRFSHAKYRAYSTAYQVIRLLIPSGRLNRRE